MATRETGLETSRFDAEDAAQCSVTPPDRVVLVLSHRGGAETVELRPDEWVVVGREPPADVEIPESSLSRCHARFGLMNGAVVVEDLGSTNGTRWRGERIDRATPAPGDEVALGAVIATVHGASGQDIRLGGIEPHDAFRRRLDSEVTRAKYFGRGFALMMIRATAKTPLRKWFQQVTDRLRAVDAIALYSHDTAEILLPEMSTEAARVFAEGFAQGASGAESVVVGVALYPQSATSAEELVELARKALQEAVERNPVRFAPLDGARRWEPEGPQEDEPVVASESMRVVVQTGKRLARGVIPVLLVGETGTGKEVVARIIHESGPRRHRPMVCVNCAAIPATLLESVLFGHERGAFTGATSQHRGVFEAADHGTVLLDEVGELPPGAQAALLRVLETKRVMRLGSSRESTVDVRILAATHRDLGAMCDEGTFRQDLFYRLNAMTITLPPLRNRQDEIEPLARRFLRDANRANGTDVQDIDPDALDVLSSHGWPGNVRELRNAIERAVVMVEGDVITVEDLPESLRSSPRARGPTLSDFRSRMDQLEAELLLEALRQCGWNQRATAEHLQMPLRTLVHKIKVHSIRRPGKTV
jgi:DNA-binding NtrC family response regulator